MKRNTKHKEFIKQLREKNRCTVNPQDIYVKTDFFDKEPNQKKSPYKLAFIVSLVLVFVSIGFISVLGVQNYKLATKEPEIVYIKEIQYMIDDSKGMPQNEKLKIKDKLDYFSFYPIGTFNHDKNTTIFIYCGYVINELNIKTYYYYYSFTFTYYSKGINVLIDNKTITVIQENRNGLLTVIDESKVDNLVFSFTVESEICTKNYIFDASNY